MSGKWTPGPWATDFGEVIRIRDVSGAALASVTHTHLSGRRNIAEVEENARLISASPQLFDALKDLVDETADMLTWGCEPDVIRNARAALAKAKEEGA